MSKYTYDPPYNLWSGNRSDSLNKWKVNYLGTIPTVADLPEEGTFKGDTYNIAEDGTNWMWNGTSWDRLDSILYLTDVDGSFSCDSTQASMVLTGTRGNDTTSVHTVDMSEIRHATNAEIDAIFEG